LINARNFFSGGFIGNGLRIPDFCRGNRDVGFRISNCFRQFLSTVSKMATVEKIFESTRASRGNRQSLWRCPRRRLAFCAESHFPNGTKSSLHFYLRNSDQTCPIQSRRNRRGLLRPAKSAKSGFNRRFLGYLDLWRNDCRWFGDDVFRLYFGNNQHLFCDEMKSRSKAKIIKK
jgi:hypothetical protein